MVENAVPIRLVEMKLEVAGLQIEELDPRTVDVDLEKSK